MNILKPSHHLDGPSSHWHEQSHHWRKPSYLWEEVVLVLLVILVAGIIFVF
jgi:hypothetical protein